MTEKVNLSAAFGQISAPWTPQLVGELNGQHVKLAKASGSFQLNGRKKGAPHQAFLRGTVDKKGVVVGKWDGTIAKKRAKGTWRAAKAK